MTSHPQNLEIVRRVCIAANPEIMEKSNSPHGIITSGFFPRIIRLSDVLYAMKDKEDICIFTDGMFCSRIVNYAKAGERNEIFKPLWKWNLLNDDLSLQSEETVLFLANILK